MIAALASVLLIQHESSALPTAISNGQQAWAAAAPVHIDSNVTDFAYAKAGRAILYMKQDRQLDLPTLLRAISTEEEPDLGATFVMLWNGQSKRMLISVGKDVQAGYIRQVDRDIWAVEIGDATELISTAGARRTLPHRVWQGPFVLADRTLIYSSAENMAYAISPGQHAPEHLPHITGLLGQGARLVRPIKGSALVYQGPGFVTFPNLRGPAKPISQDELRQDDPAELPPYQITVRPTKLNKPGPAIWSIDGTDSDSNAVPVPKSAPIAGDASQASLAPDHGQAAYISNGSLFTRNLEPVDLAFLTKMAETEARTMLLVQAKQIGTALSIYAADNEGRLPPKGRLKEALGKYFKDADFIDDFVPEWTATHFDEIPDPSTAVLGHMRGERGRAVLYADTHARWFKD